MPLIKSKSKEAVGKNIATEVAAGKPRKQAIAIALETQRRASHQAGGPVMLKGTGPIAATYARGGPVLNTGRSIFMKEPDQFRTNVERQDYGRATDPHVKRTGDKSEKPVKPRT